MIVRACVRACGGRVRGVVVERMTKGWAGARGEHACAGATVCNEHVSPDSTPIEVNLATSETVR